MIVLRNHRNHKLFKRIFKFFWEYIAAIRFQLWWNSLFGWLQWCYQIFWTDTVYIRSYKSYGCFHVFIDLIFANIEDSASSSVFQIILFLIILLYISLLDEICYFVEITPISILIYFNIQHLTFKYSNQQFHLQFLIITSLKNS